MADPKRDAPHHPSHPGNYAGKIPDNRAVGGGARRVWIVIGVLVLVLAVGWLLIGGGDKLGDQTLGEPAGVGEAAVEREVEAPEPPHAVPGEASEASTELAPDVIDAEPE